MADDERKAALRKEMLRREQARRAGGPGGPSKTSAVDAPGLGDAEPPVISGSATATASRPLIDIDAVRKGGERWLLGVDDEVAGVAAEIGDAVGSDSPLTSLRDLAVTKLYGGGGRSPVNKEAVGQRRADVDAAYERSPGSYVLGAVPAAVVTGLAGGGAGAASKGAPLLTRAVAGAGQALRAAPLAFAQGAGLSDADGDEATEAGATAAGLTAALSAASPVAGAAVGKGAGAIRNVLRRTGEKADELRVLTASGATGGSIARPAVLRKAEEVPGGIPEVARVMRDTGISTGIVTTSGVAKRTQAAKDTAQKVISDTIDEVDATGWAIDPKKIAATLRARAAAIQKAVGADDPANAGVVKELLAAADAMEANGAMSMRGAQTRIAGNDAVGVKGLADRAQFARRAQDLATSDKGDAAAATVRVLREGMDEVTAKALPAGRDAAYKDARRTWQVANIVDDATEESLARANKNNLLGLTDATLLAGGAPGAGLAALRKLAGPVTASTRATAAEWAQKIAANPSLLDGAGPAAELFVDAARRGGPALLAAINGDGEPASAGVLRKTGTPALPVLRPRR